MYQDSAEWANTQAFRDWVYENYTAEQEQEIGLVELRRIYDRLDD